MDLLEYWGWGKSLALNWAICILRRMAVSLAPLTNFLAIEAILRDYFTNRRLLLAINPRAPIFIVAGHDRPEQVGEHKLHRVQRRGGRLEGRRRCLAFL